MSGGPLIAAFLSPGLFFGGAAAMSVPIIIHLLARRRFKRIRWAAMDFLIDAERRNRRRIRMEEWVLLALRCLAVFLLGTFLARPFLRPASAVALFGGSHRSERVFVLDDSLSMSYRSADGTALERAKTAVRRLLELVRRESPDDTVTLIRTSAPHTPVDSSTYLDDSQMEELLARLEAVPQTQRFTDPGLTLEGVAEVLARSPDITHAAIYVLSDFQKNQWVSVEAAVAGPARTESLLQPLATWAAGGERGLHLTLINVGDPEAANLAVEDLTLQSPQLVAGATGMLRASLANWSSLAVENLDLHVWVGAFEQSTKTVRSLDARQEASIDLPTEFLRAGHDTLRVELPADAMPADNVRYAAVEVAAAIRILVVNGEPATDAYDDEVTYLVTALRPEGEVFSGNEVMVVDEAQFDDAILTNFHLVILANVYRLSEPGVENLERFVRGGGGLLIFLGDQVDADLYNSALYRGGEGVLASELKEVIRPVEPVHLTVTDRLHPALQGLSQEGDPLGLGQVAFFQYFACTPPTAEPDKTDDATGENVQAGAGPASATPIARIVARYADADEHPAILERRVGTGRVVLVTTGVDREWNQWPDHPTFLPVVLELARHVARATHTGRGTFVGEPLELPLDPSAFEPEATVRAPGFPGEADIAVTATPDSEGRGLRLLWEHSEAAGIYQFSLRHREQGEVMRPVSVNIDSRESDLAAPSEDELRRVLTGVPFDYIVGIDKLMGASGEPRIEIWRPALVAMVMALMLEQTLAWWWGRRR